jgi:6-phosphofructokinase 1
LALWTGLSGGADVIMIPEDPSSADFDHVLSVIQANRARGKNHNIIVVAEGVVAEGYLDGTQQLAQRIQEETGIESRATVLGHVQRGGSPTVLDIKHASMMGAYAVDLLCQGMTDRVVAYRGNQYVDFDIDEALQMKRPPSLDILETNLSISTY